MLFRVLGLCALCIASGQLGTISPLPFTGEGWGEGITPTSLRNRE